MSTIRTVMVLWIVLTGLTLHAQAGGDTQPAEAPTSVESFISSRLPIWQKRLNLEEWRITIVFTPRSTLKPGTLGAIRWDKGKRTAHMFVLHPSEYKTTTEETLKDMEFTLVHELIHLELASLPRSEASRSTEEKAVNNLAKALLALNSER